MNKHSEKPRNRWPRVPRWVGEEWVLQLLLAVLVLPVAAQALLSTGSGIA